MLDLNYEETISNIAAPAGHDILVYEDTGPGVPQFSAINLTLTTNNIGVSPNVELNQRSVIKNALNAGNNNSNPLTPSNPWVTSGFNAIQFFNTSGAFGDDEYGGIDFVEGTDDPTPDPTPGQNFTFFVGDPSPSIITNDLRSKDISTISGMDSGKTYTSAVLQTGAFEYNNATPTFADVQVGPISSNPTSRNLAWGLASGHCFGVVIH